MDKLLPNFKYLNNEDGKVYGRYNTITSINPYNCYFIAHYPTGGVVKGQSLFITGWDDIPQGLCKLEYFLSTGQLITVPLYKAYKPLIDCSVGVDGSRIFHSIRVNCLDERSIVIFKIILKKEKNGKYNIGDCVLSRTNVLPESFDKAWKFISIG